MKVLPTKRRAAWLPIFGATVLWMLAATTRKLRRFDLAGMTDADKIALARRLSLDLGGGACMWTDAMPAGKDADVYGTLLAGYPGSGMRVAWQHTEGISGIQVGDDFYLGGEGVADKTGLLKTQYPHLEGIWSWGSNMEQVVLLLRNPRWTIPSYHSFLWEIDYAHDWETAYEYLHDTFQRRPPVSSWVQWRDYRFEEELDLWVWHIDYYMEGGTQYWMDLDYERNGQWPFRFLTDEERYTKEKDPHCVYQMDCVAKEIVTYENLINPDTGPDELTKIAAVLRGKQGMNMLVGDDAIACVYNETWARAKMPFNNNRDESGATPAETYEFKSDQLDKIIQALQALIDKYSVGDWASNPVANTLVSALSGYQSLASAELEERNAAGLPASEPITEEYRLELVGWYSALGRGNRYDKAKIQQMFSYWPLVKHMYESEE